MIGCFYIIYFRWCWLYTDVFIFYWLFLVLWDYSACLNLPFRESRFLVLYLEWRHMIVMASQITVPSTVYSTVCLGLQRKKHPNSLIGSVIICNELLLDLWDCPCWCFSLAFEKSHFAALSLQWRDISVKAYRITEPLTICSTTCPSWQQRKHPNPRIGDITICNTQIAFWWKNRRMER